MIETQVLTTQLLWRAALVAVLVDTPLMVLVGTFIKSDLFHKLKWYFAGAAFLVFGLIWLSQGSLIFWDEVYSQIFPAWSRWLLGPWFGLVEGVLALAFWRLAQMARGGQAVIFCLCGGLVSLLGHGIGFSLGLMDVPMLAQASPISALAFGVFEFIFYWCIIVGIGAVGKWIRTAVEKAVKAKSILGS